MRRKDNQESLKEAISSFLRQNSKLANGLLRHKVIAAWHEVVGEHISRKTLDVWYGNKKLFVKLDSSTLKNELHYRKKSLLDSLNKTLEIENAVEELILK